MKQNLPVILLRGNFLFPYNEIRLEFDNELSKTIIEVSELFHNSKILIINYLGLEENPKIEELSKIGIITKIKHKLELPNGKTRVILEGKKRAKVFEYLKPSEDVLEAIVSEVEIEPLAEEVNFGMIRKLYGEMEAYIKSVPYMSNSVLSQIQDVKDLDKMTDIIVNQLPISTERLSEYLKVISPIKRVEMILEDIYKEEQLFSIEKKLDSKVKKDLDKDQKDFILRQKIKLLKEELGEESILSSDVNELKEKVKNLLCSSEIKNKILYEIKRYSEMSQSSPELAMVRNYIDWMINLPWNIKTCDYTDLKEVKENLDKSHYDLKHVKERIIEYLAVKKNSPLLRAPIICLVGPPGVGKTTLAYSIAKSIKRNFVKISVGGISDEAEIVGHRRTYLASSPGRIIDGLKRAKSSNPVFLIDEIDKMTKGITGDPSSSLLEILDVSQNKYFKDKYIEESFDLSDVMFICTANDSSKIPEALKDRLELIYINGYTELEKIDIAKKYLIPKISYEHGISNLKISDEKLSDIIKYYTKEAGLRELERQISKIARKVVTDGEFNNKLKTNISSVEKYLGKKIYFPNEKIDEIGVCNALAYTNYGGDILPIEVNYYKGSGKLIITGQLGDVMKESSKIALSYIKANYELFKIDYSKLVDNDIHINVPDIATKKEGPSAGVALVTAIISALTDFKINNKVAMTGEITLRGKIYKIGGIKEKSIGAYKNGIEKMFIPYDNILDLGDVPKEIKDKVEFIPVKKYDEIFYYLKKEF